jgi:hypothetical protein
MWKKWLRGKLDGTITYTLESINGRTKLTLVVVLEMPSGILLKIVEPLFLRMDRKMFENQLETLNTILGARGMRCEYMLVMLHREK